MDILVNISQEITLKKNGSHHLNIVLIVIQKEQKVRMGELLVHAEELVVVHAEELVVVHAEELVVVHAEELVVLQKDDIVLILVVVHAKKLLVLRMGD